MRDDTLNAEARYRARFTFDPNSISIGYSGMHDIFVGRSGTIDVFRVQVTRLYGSYQLRTQARFDSATYTTTAWLPISDAAHLIEIDWQAATSSGANNGSLTLWIDGAPQSPLANLDNDTRRIDEARLGPSNGIDTYTRGTEYFDDFESRRSTYIGPVVPSNVASVIRKSYYRAGAQLIAMRVEGDPVVSNNGLFFLHSDHLGSASLTTNASGTSIARQLYDAWGNIRVGASTGSMPTDIGYTGQRLDASTGGLMFYNARYYAPSLNRFISADTMVPSPSDPQQLNRYAYTRNNPVKYTDPSGHCLGIFAGIDTLVCLLLIGGGAAIGGLTYEYYVGPSTGQRPDHKGAEAANERWATIAGAALDVNIPPIALGAGVAVQSQWYFAPVQGLQDTGERALGDTNPSQGIAQLTPGEARYFPNGVYAPFDENASIAALGNKISESVGACSNCSITDQFIVMGLAQNYFLPDSVAALPRIQGSNQVDWNTVFNGDPSHLWSKELPRLWTRGIRGESTSWLRYLLQVFTNDLLDLQSQGWEMPAGVNISYMQCLASGTNSSCTP